VGFGSIGRGNGEAPAGEARWCGLPTRGRAINEDAVERVHRVRRGEACICGLP